MGRESTVSVLAVSSEEGVGGEVFVFGSLGGSGVSS